LPRLLLAKQSKQLFDPAAVLALPHLCVTPAIRLCRGGDLKKRASTASESFTAIVAFLLFLEFAPDKH